MELRANGWTMNSWAPQREADATRTHMHAAPVCVCVCLAIYVHVCLQVCVPVCVCVCVLDPVSSKNGLCICMYNKCYTMAAYLALSVSGSQAVRHASVNVNLSHRLTHWSKLYSCLGNTRFWPLKKGHCGCQNCGESTIVSRKVRSQLTKKLCRISRPSAQACDLISIRFHSCRIEKVLKCNAT